MPLIVIYIFIKTLTSVVDWEEKKTGSRVVIGIPEPRYSDTSEAGADAGPQLCPPRDAAYRASLTWDPPPPGCERRKGFALHPKVSANPCKPTLFIDQGFCCEDPRSVCTKLLRGGERRWQEATPTAGFLPITPALTYRFSYFPLGCGST